MDPAVVVDSERGARVVVQEVRCELRYWLATNRDPSTVGAETELGVVASREDLIELCNEFLRDAVRPRDLMTPRSAGPRTVTRGGG